jgi:hypothetical protein
MQSNMKFEEESIFDRDPRFVAVRALFNDGGPVGQHIVLGKALLSDHPANARICPTCGGPKLPDLGKCEACIKASWNDGGAANE